MSQISPNLNLPFLQPSQAQKHVTHNEALQILDALAQLRLEATDANTPPIVPGDGDTWALGAAPTGLWSGHAEEIAVWTNGSWLFVPIEDGLIAWDKGTSALVVRSAGQWIAPGGLSAPTVFGVNATADTTNRLAVASDAVLFSHAGAGHQVKLNKSSQTDTASLLYQTGFSGRAEMGLAGNDNWSIKVSADGSNWTSAIELDAATGAVSGASVQSAANDTGAGKLARADYVYGPGNLLGAVSESGGQPTGAVLESGSNANGRFTRFADGTQICMASGITFTQDFDNYLRADWTFPVAFSEAPSVQSTLSFLAADRTDVNLTDLGNLASSFGTSSTTLNLYRSAGASAFPATAEVRNVRLLAIGRWF